MRWRSGSGRGRLAAVMMANVTAISVNAAYGFAVLIFLVATICRKTSPVVVGEVSPPVVPIGKVPVWFYRHADLIGVAVIGGFFYLMAIGNATVTMEEKTSGISLAGLIFNIGLQFALAGTALAIVIGRIRPVAWLGLVWKQWWLVVLIAPVTVVSMWAVIAGLYSVGYMQLLERLEVETVQTTVALFQKTEDMRVLVMMGITAAIVAPICEEVVFRGYLYPVMKKFAGPWVGALCSALIFSAAHGSMSALLPLLIFGVVLVALYEWTGSIWAPMAVHFLFNAATVAVQMMVRFGYIPEVTPQ